MSDAKQKEEFLKIQSYEEFDRKRDLFKGLKMDKDIRDHIKKVFPPIELFEGDVFYKVPKENKDNSN